jgi:hypothetical protein
MTTAAPSSGSATREILGCELAAEVLRSFGRLRLGATGASMLPAVWPGDILSVRRHDGVEPLPGDIILYGRGGKLIAHRVVEIRSQESGARGQEQSPITHQPSPMLTLVTRGDNVGCNDPPISSNEMLGRVIAIERGSRQLSPHQSAASRLASWILCRTELATRVVLGIRNWGFMTRASGVGIRG